MKTLFLALALIFASGSFASAKDCYRGPRERRFENARPAVKHHMRKKHMERKERRMERREEKRK